MEISITQQHVNLKPTVVQINPCCNDMGDHGYGFMFRLVGDDNCVAARSYRYPRLQVRRFGQSQAAVRFCPFCGTQIKIMDVTNTVQRDRTY